MHNVLLSVGQICETGCSLPCNKKGGVIQDKAGHKIAFTRGGGVYACTCGLKLRTPKKQCTPVEAAKEGRSSDNRRQTCDECKVCYIYDALSDDEADMDPLDFTRPLWNGAWRTHAGT